MQRRRLPNVKRRGIEMARATRLSIIFMLLVTFVAGAIAWGGLSVMTAAQATSEQVPFDTYGWKTNFAKHSVPLTEIMSGGPSKDGIPAVDKPSFETVVEANKWLKPKEPVILFEHKGEARAYPLQVLIWHEIANDTVAGMPVTVTFCPLCNTAIVFDRTLNGMVLDFGTTGRLRFSDLVMYDRQTESWWQQVTGEAIVGDLTGQRLKFLPAQIIAWDTFKAQFAQGKVLSRNTGHRRAYGENPYVGYDNVTSSPFLYAGPRDARLRPMERVVTVSTGTYDVAYPFSLLETVRVVNDTIGNTPIVVLFEKGVASALDSSSIADSRDIGAAAVFERTLNGKVMTFKSTGGKITDSQTGSTWNVLGIATTGQLKGTRLTQVVSGNHFWFSWAVFKPKTRVYSP